jgi:hypothetical protein
MSKNEKKNEMHEDSDESFEEDEEFETGDDQWNDTSYVDAVAEAQERSKKGSISVRMEYLRSLNADQLVAILNALDMPSLSGVLQGEMWSGVSLNEVRTMLNTMYNRATFYQNNIEIAQDREATSSEIIVKVETERAFIAQLLIAYGTIKQNTVVRAGKVSKEPIFVSSGVNLPKAAMAIKAGQHTLTGVGFSSFCKKYVDQMKFEMELPNLLPAIYLNRTIEQLDCSIKRLALTCDKINTSSTAHETFNTIGRSTCFYEATPVSIGEVINTLYRQYKCVSVGGDLLPKTLGSFFDKGEVLRVTEKRAFTTNADIELITGIPEFLATSKPIPPGSKAVKYVLVALSNPKVAVKWATKLAKTHRADLILCKIPSILFYPHPDVGKENATACYFAATTNMANAVYFNWRSAFAGKNQAWRINFLPTDKGCKTAITYTPKLVVKRYAVQQKTSKDLLLDEAALGIDASFIYTEPAPNAKRSKRSADGSPAYEPTQNQVGVENFRFYTNGRVITNVMTNEPLDYSYTQLSEPAMELAAKYHSILNTEAPFWEVQGNYGYLWGVMIDNTANLKAVIYAAVYLKPGFYRGPISN